MLSLPRPKFAPGMRNVSDEICRQNQKTRFVFNNFLLFVFENRTVYEVRWKHIIEPGRPKMTVWCMRIQCWTPKAANTQSEYVMFISFRLQKWLHQHASMLHYTNIACLVCVWCPAQTEN